MKIQCDVCGGDAASVFCCADEAAVCDACDRRVHGANRLAGKHRRFSLSSQSQPVCDICQERRGMVFCQEDRAILCRDCDFSVHSANQHTMKHSRFLLAGIRLSQTPIPESPQPDQNTKNSLNPTPPQDKPIVAAANNTTNNNSSNSSNSSSSISEYLTKTLPGYRVDDLLDVDDYKSDTMTPFLEVDLEGGCVAEDFPIWVPHVPQIAPPNLFAATKVPLDNYQVDMTQLQCDEAKAGRDRWNDDLFMVPQITAGPTTGGKKRARPCSSSSSSFWYF